MSYAIQRVRTLGSLGLQCAFIICINLPSAYTYIHTYIPTYTHITALISGLYFSFNDKTCCGYASKYGDFTVKFPQENNTGIVIICYISGSHPAHDWSNLRTHRSTKVFGSGT